MSRKDAGRAKNMFALGLLSWLYGRPAEGTKEFLREEVREQAQDRGREHHGVQGRGGTSGRPPSRSAVSYEVKPAVMPAGEYRNITGNIALSYGLVAASQRSRLPLFLGAYPITPASDILHELSKHKGFGVRTFQAEDEIAGIGAALGAAFGGALGVTTTSGPGIVLKSETIGLAVSLELPLVIVNIQRGGPSTGLPTKTEQADLLQAMFGRNGEAPMAIVAPQSPADCFDAAMEAGRIALELPDAGDAAVGRVPGQRRRAVAAAGRGRTAGPAVEFATELNHTKADGTGSSGRTCATRDPRPAVGRAGHPGAGAPRRRHGEGRRARQHLLRPRQPRPDGAHPPGQDRRRRPNDPDAGGRRPVRPGPRAGAGLGLDLRPDRRGLPPGPARPGGRSPRRTCAT